MKSKIFFAAAFLLFLPQQAHLQEDSYIAPLASESMLMDIIANDGKLIAVGERGHLLISEDNGESWTQKVVPTVSLLTSVFALGDNIWAVGHDSVIIASKDKGETWELQQFLPDLERPLMDVVFFDESHGVAIGAYGVFFRTRDGGANWERQYHITLLHPDDQDYLNDLREEDEAFYQEELASILPHLNRLKLSDDKLLLVGETGLTAYSENLGESWQRVETGYYGSFFDVTELSDGSVLAAGLRGNVFKSDASLEQWERIPTDTTSTFNSITPLGADKLALVGNGGTVAWYDSGQVVVQTTDDGKSIVNAISVDDKITAVSAVGIKSLVRE